MDAVASEDMDTLPFGGNVLVRQFNAKKDRQELSTMLKKNLSNLKHFFFFCVVPNCFVTCRTIGQ